MKWLLLELTQLSGIVKRKSFKYEKNCMKQKQKQKQNKTKIEKLNFDIRVCHENTGMVIQVKYGHRLLR
jgi:hypothetical protein